MGQSRLTVAIVTYRTPELALACVARVLEQRPSVAVRVVDSAPTDAFAAELRSAHPTAVYVPVVNRSYSHAVNVGLAGVESEYVALMNADVELGNDTFPALIGALDADATAGAAGPLALTPRGSPQDLGPLYRLKYAALARRRARSTAREAPVSVEVPWLSGCLQVVRLSWWRAAGGYDEAFRFTNEDLDFGLRLSAMGARSLLVDTPVVHLGGTSTPAHPAFSLEGRRGGLLVGRRHYPPALQAAQRAFVYLEATIGSVFAPTPGARAASGELRRMALSGDIELSPFGATLDERPAW